MQRILLELLTQMDGFDQSVNVKVIMATNRQDTLDPALLRPGRLDRKVQRARLLPRSLRVAAYSNRWLRARAHAAAAQVEFPIPDRRQKRLIFGVCTSKMSLADDVDLESFVARPDKLSGAEIASVCLEAGMQAVRKNRYIILQKDFDKAFKVVLKKDNDDYQFYK